MGADSFRWPPREVPNDAGARERVGERRTPTDVRRSGWRGVWAELESMWLAPEAASLARRIEASGWRADEPGAWCDRCGATVGPHEENEFGCSACRGKRLGWDRAVRLGEHTGELREWIHELKFTRFRAVGVGLGRRLGAQLRRCGLEGGSGVVVCPMPTTWRRRTVRGIDHAGAIARGVGLELGSPVRRLLRRRHRASQTSLPASARGRNVSGAFLRRERVRRGGVAAGTVVVLVDDVTTTGSTARAAARALVRGLGEGERPASVWLAVAAAAARPGGAESVGTEAPAGEGVRAVEGIGGEKNADRGDRLS